MIYRVHPKEHLYFLISLLVSIAVYGLLIAGIGAVLGALLDASSGGPELFEMIGVFLVFGIYAVVLFGLFFLRHVLVIGYLQGNGIRITERQFPEIDAIFREEAAQLGLKKLPTLYVIESGGMLNAFATRFLGRSYVVVYADVLEKAYEEGRDAVAFILAHELCHVQRRHLLKGLLTLPALFVPFLRFAYMRACEYTCDSCGTAFTPEGAEKGLLILAAGKRLYAMVDTDEYLQTFDRERSPWKWLAEKLSTHPHTPKRLREVRRLAAWYREREAMRQTGAPV